MTMSSSSTSQRRTRSRASTVLSSVVVLLLTQNRITPADCFQSSTTAAPTARPTTRRSSPGRTAVHFRNEQHAAHEQAFVPAAFVSSPPPHPNTAAALDAASSHHHLPTWLKVPRSHLAQANKQALQKAMRDSYFTESEYLKVLYAIEEATKGDREKVAGAAEFCLILTETMEMGLEALLAAAYHYASCVTAREHAGQWQPLDAASQAALTQMGHESVRIANDAARLKQLEVVFQTVMQQDQSRVRPDSTDAENLRKLLTSETHDWRALAIRSAACLYRLRGLLSEHQHARSDHGKRTTPEAARTAREALTIYAPLASRLGMHRLKNELEGAAFSILYPRQHQRVHDMTHCHSAGHDDIGESMKHVLETAQQEMTYMLQQDEEFNSLVNDFTVTARLKEPFSLHRKMLARGYKHISQVPDALALRIVLNGKKLTPNEDAEVTRARERALCYYAQRLCMTSRWQPVADPRFKDYIEHPKPNGYQSLHYTAGAECHGQQWTVEIQVRSGEMHQVAEYGVAGHWEYKLQQQQAQESNAEQQEAPRTVQIQQDGYEIDNYLRHDMQQWHWQQHGGSQTTSSTDDRTDRLRERTERLEPYIQALTEAQSDLARDYVFVFVDHQPCRDPQFLALPAGARVSDALAETGLLQHHHHHEQPFVVNGDAVSMSRQLQNGDVLALHTTAAVCS